MPVPRLSRWLALGAVVTVVGVGWYGKNSAWEKNILHLHLRAQLLAQCALPDESGSSPDQGKACDLGGTQGDVDAGCAVSVGVCDTNGSCNPDWSKTDDDGCHPADEEELLDECNYKFTCIAGVCDSYVHNGGACNTLHSCVVSNCVDYACQATGQSRGDPACDDLGPNGSGLDSNGKPVVCDANCHQVDPCKSPDADPVCVQASTNGGKDSAGNTISCDANCKRVPSCGDGIVDDGEQCDDGKNNIDPSIADKPEETDAAFDDNGTDDSALTPSDIATLTNGGCLNDCQKPECSAGVDKEGDTITGVSGSLDGSIDPTNETYGNTVPYLEEQACSTVGRGFDDVESYIFTEDPYPEDEGEGEVADLSPANPARTGVLDASLLADAAGDAFGDRVAAQLAADAANAGLKQNGPLWGAACYKLPTDRAQLGGGQSGTYGGKDYAACPPNAFCTVFNSANLATVAGGDQPNRSIYGTFHCRTPVADGKPCTTVADCQSAYAGNALMTTAQLRAQHVGCLYTNGGGNMDVADAEGGHCCEGSNCKGPEKSNPPQGPALKQPKNSSSSSSKGSSAGGAGGGDGGGTTAGGTTAGGTTAGGTTAGGTGDSSTASTDGGGGGTGGGTSSSSASGAASASSVASGGACSANNCETGGGTYCATLGEVCVDLPTSPCSICVVSSSSSSARSSSTTTTSSAVSIASACGDGICSGGETCGTCSQDCGTCCTAPTCGDAICESNESCTSCPTDCGVCASSVSSSSASSSRHSSSAVSSISAASSSSASSVSDTCPTDACAGGGDSYCESIGQTCQNLADSPCVQCVAIPSPSSTSSASARSSSFSSSLVASVPTHTSWLTSTVFSSAPPAPVSSSSAPVASTLIAAASVCGNGVKEPGEECDDGNTRNLDGCNAKCLLERGFCGDGIVEKALGEQCEPSLQDPSLPFGCDSHCHFILSSCGDGKLDLGEECDDGTSNSDASDAHCRTNCRLGRCGDGIIDTLAGEECDDGNTVDGDGCSSDCKVERPAPLAAQLFTLPIPATPMTPAQPQSPLIATTLVTLPPRTTSSGPASAAVMAAGAAAGVGWVRRHKRRA